MIFALVLFATTLSGQEANLMAKLPAVFERSAAHYKALDAAATPLMKDEEGMPRMPHGFDRARRELDMRSIYWWTSGHFPGSLWYLYEATGDAFFKNRATAWTEILAPVSTYEGTHDIGFMMYCSYGNARRVLKTEKYDALLAEAAATLAKRHHDGLGLIRSWGEIDEKKDFLVIPDNLMNLELLEWAGKGFSAIARAHADMTMRHHFRSDGGCYHVLDYDQETGRVKGIERGQGASCETTWARGQSWAIYGYTMMYRTSGYVRYLDFAKKLADYAMNHPNMPEDGVPYWDYGAPGEERDSSAGAVMASALLELSQYVGGADRARYRAFAVKQLLALASSAYFSEGDEAGHFLLKHGVGHKPGGSEVDTPLDYGDYYFLEALLRFRELKAAEAKGERWARSLPPKAVLPADELLRRPFGRNWTNAQEVAEAALVQPIPDTSDELYGEFWATGNRTRYQARYYTRLANLDALVTAEAAEGKGRYLTRIEDYLRAICEMKAWVWPAHDWSDGGRGAFRGTWISTDLVATEMGAHLACVVRLLGDTIDPALVAHVKAECERRVLGPIRREARFVFDPGMCDEAVNGKANWWINGGNNWNAVCWDNAVCCAMGILDDPIERARFVVWADQAAERYLADGFAEDGYCSEGMGYWNYGFGHHLLTGRLLDELTGGKSDFFRRPKQRLIAAYARAYTLREGVSPAFADGNGAASPQVLALVDRYWPDLPKALAPQSEFPSGQVWLFRDSEGVSVAFKGSHNAELHNHNDIGSYYVMFGDRFVSGDPGGEVYTAQTFSTNRYASKVLSSYGHPVPVVGGVLQSVGRKAAAKVVSKVLDREVQTVALDLTAAYDVPELEFLVRTFVYDRPAKTFTVTDKVSFRKPTAFESAFNTYLERDNPTNGIGNGKIAIGWDVRPEISVKGGAYELVEEDVPNPDRLAPHRVAVRFKDPVVTAEVAFVFRR